VEEEEQGAPYEETRVNLRAHSPSSFTEPLSVRNALEKITGAGPLNVSPDCRRRGRVWEAHRRRNVQKMWGTLETVDGEHDKEYTEKASYTFSTTEGAELGNHPSLAAAAPNGGEKVFSPALKPERSRHASRRKRHEPSDAHRPCTRSSWHKRHTVCIHISQQTSNLTHRCSKPQTRPTHQTGGRGSGKTEFNPRSNLQVSTFFDTP
jgi:hypothetical protein